MKMDETSRRRRQTGATDEASFWPGELLSEQTGNKE